MPRFKPERRSLVIIVAIIIWWVYYFVLVATTLSTPAPATSVPSLIVGSHRLRNYIVVDALCCSLFMVFVGTTSIFILKRGSITERFIVFREDYTP